MKIGRWIRDFWVEAEGSMTECFDQLASAEEVLTQSIPKEIAKENDPTNWKFQTRRHVDGKKSMVFRELVQRDKPNARLSIGEHAEGGTLYPKRTDGDGNKLGLYGWTVWDREKGEEVKF